MWTQGGRSQHRGYRITQSLHCVAKSNSFAECVLLNNPPGEPPHLASAATRPRDHPLNLSGVPWSTLMAGEPSDAPDWGHCHDWRPCLDICGWGSCSLFCFTHHHSVPR